MAGWLALATVAGAVGGRFSDRAAQEFGKAEARYRQEPQNTEATWQFARACFDLAEFSTNSTERAAIAERGIAAARALAEREPRVAAARYYLGMNLGQLARTRTLGAFKLVREMEREFTQAAELDERFDYAGPQRNLGMLYRDAPVIGSVGSRSKANQHLSRAATLAPGYPENRLALAEGFLKWNDRAAGRRELKALEDGMEAARKEFSGPAWASSWADWDQRIAELKRKLDAPARLSAPK